MTIKIAFCGWAGSGKTEAANYLSAKYGCEVVSFADGIKFIDRYLFGSGAKNRERLQKIGEFFRSVDPNVWVKRTVEVVSEEGDFVIDDLRRENEHDALLKEGFVVFRIVADEEVRIKRLVERDGQCDVSLLYNESENGLAHMAMKGISNNGTLEELYDKIDKLMESWVGI